jgi:hypothetical protein
MSSRRWWGVGWLCLLALWVPSPTRAQTFPVNPVVVTGPTSERINLIFLAEGYTAGEMGKFELDVQKALTGLFNTPPYHEYESFFNVYAVEVVSNESGADHPYTAPDCPAGLDTLNRDTYFNSSFDIGSIHRLLVPEDALVFPVLIANTPFWDVAFVIVNISYYGGAGGAFATFSTHASSAEIAIHELGHAFADLADEYEYGGGGGYESPNSTSELVRELIKWNDWIDPGTPLPTPETSTYGTVIGLFEGAVYLPTGWYRPKLNCKMRNLGVPFCAVCSEQTIRSVYNLVDAVHRLDPPDPLFSIPGNATRTFWVDLLEPTGQTVHTEWRLDGVPVAFDVDHIDIDANPLDSGNHLLEVLAMDSTTLVRTDPFGLLSTGTSWTVHVESAAPCPIMLTGDVDESAAITSADIIGLVNYVFKGGLTPLPCAVAGDVNCSGAVTSSDIIELVGFVFKGGEAPCDACSLLTPGYWNCP